MGADLWVLSPGMLLRGSDATINQNRQGEQAESDEEEVAGERMGGGSLNAQRPSVQIFPAARVSMSVCVPKRQRCEQRLLPSSTAAAQ